MSQGPMNIDNYKKIKKDKKEVSYDVLSYQLECANNELDKISIDIHNMNKKFRDETK